MPGSLPANHKKVTVLHCLPKGFSLGGVVSWCVRFAREALMQEREVTLGCHGGRKTGDLQVPSDITVIDFEGPYASAALRWHVHRCAKKIETLAPCVIYPNGGHMAYAAACLLKRRNIPAYVVGMAHADEPQYYEYLKYYEPIIDQFVGVSPVIRDKLCACLPDGRQDDVHSITYGVPIRPEVSTSSNPSRGVLQLLYCGRLVDYQKRVLRLVDLCRILEKRGRRFVLHIAGDGPLRSALTDGLKPFGPSVEFHGQLDQLGLTALMENMDALVMVSDFEGTSVAMLEAMSYGIVPLVSEVSGVAAVVREAENGYCHRIGDMEQLADQVVELDSDRSRLRRLSDSARETVSRNYSIAENVSRHARLYSNWGGTSSALHARLAKPLIPIDREIRLIRLRGLGWLKTRAELVSAREKKIRK